VFHDFMFEANKLKNARVARTKPQQQSKPSATKQPASKHETEEERMIRLAIEASLAEDSSVKLDKLSEEEQERIALAASLAEQRQTKLDSLSEEEMLKLALEESRLQE
jgi:hypothetical protein